MSSNLVAIVETAVEYIWGGALRQEHGGHHNGDSLDNVA
jgi:hypothetical protein